jgi:energy-converting hydrogenase Eha subunit A
MKKILSLLLALPLIANDALFQQAQTKVSSFNTGLISIGVAVLTLSIMVAALGAVLGWFNRATALRIAVGGVIFGIAGTLASWLVGTN